MRPFSAQEAFLEGPLPSECQAEEKAAQQRVVDIPAADLGIAVQNVEEGRGRAGESAQVDHALARGERPVEEAHAVDVDQLKPPLLLLGVVSAEDVPLVEVTVVDPLFVEFCNEAGEGVESGRLSTSGKRLANSDSGLSSE